MESYETMTTDEILFDQLVKLRNKLFDAETNNVDLIKHKLDDGQELLDEISNLITKVTHQMELVRDTQTTIDSEEESYSPTSLVHVAESTAYVVNSTPQRLQTNVS